MEVLWLPSPASSKIQEFRSLFSKISSELLDDPGADTRNAAQTRVSSTAQTLLSTRPVAKPISRTRSSVKSIGVPEAFLGQAIHRPPAGQRRWAKLENRWA